MGAVLISLGFAIIFLGLISKKRFRRFWMEIISIRSEIQVTRKEITSLRKQLFLVSINHKLRLPARLPSEDGEEIVLYNFFNHKHTGFYIEIGAYTGVELSNTYFFEALGWDGILIEPDPYLYQKCVAARPNSRVINAAASDKEGSLRFNCAVGKEWLSFSGENKMREDRVLAKGAELKTIEVPCLTLNEILKNSNRQIDLVSLDVEGYEFNVLKGFDLHKFRPRVILIEQSEHDNDSPCSRLMRENGYTKRYHLGSNSFYVQVDEESNFSW